MPDLWITGGEIGPKTTLYMPLRPYKYIYWGPLVRTFARETRSISRSSCEAKCRSKRIRPVSVISLATMRGRLSNCQLYG